MAKDPAFLFYSSDFLTGTMLFSHKERGQYITLLCTMHQQGRLTLGEIKVVLNGYSVSPAVLKKFSIDDEGRYFNERLENEMEKRKKFTESRRNSLNINNGDLVYIYLLFDPKSENYKIGSSKYPVMRLTEIQKKRPGVTLYWKTEKMVERANEKKLHENFKNKRVNHDWFLLTKEDLAHIEKIFRTEDCTEVRTEDENENVIENTLSVGKYGFTSDKVPEDYPIKETEIENTIEFISTTGKKILAKNEVLDYWQAFKIQQRTAPDHYASRGKFVQHFRNWLKIEIQKHGGKTHQGSSAEGKSGGTSTNRTGAIKGWTIGG